MAWFSGKVSLGGFPDIAGAVNKLSESVKNIEKNFDTALGFEERASGTSSSEGPGLWPSATDRKALFDPVMAFMGQKGGESNVELSDKIDTTKLLSSSEEKEEVESDVSANSAAARAASEEEAREETVSSKDHIDTAAEVNASVAEGTDDIDAVHLEVNSSLHNESSDPIVERTEESNSVSLNQHKQSPELVASETSGQVEAKVVDSVDEVDGVVSSSNESHDLPDLRKDADELKTQEEETSDRVALASVEDALSNDQSGIVPEPETKPVPSSPSSVVLYESARSLEYSTRHLPEVQDSDKYLEVISESVPDENGEINKAFEVNLKEADNEIDIRKGHLSSGSNSSAILDPLDDLEKVKREMKMMEAALQGAARQAQAKADEIATLMNENEQLKAVIEDLKRKSNEAEIESLREEYHQRVAALERKVYALTKERDTLRREQSKKSDAAALLKEKDEIINQVMAEGEELSKKQAAQEAQIRKLRAQIRELEEEKKGLSAKLQLEENKVESMRKDKAATENLLQETIEKHQVELSSQKEYYTNALNAAKESEALAEARANNEARTELESRLREAEERESMLVRALEELRQTLTRKEQEAVFREDMLRRDVEDLQKRYQASERRCEELIAQVPESTRPLLRQIEAIQETSARRAEAWAAVERSLNSRLQEAEAESAAAEEKERSANERLSQTLSRINVLEAQIACLRTEQAQQVRSLEKERQRAAESRQEYLALKEEADTHEGRVNQLEVEIRELRRKHKQELQEALTHQELLQREIEREKAARLELERTACLQSNVVSDQGPMTKRHSDESSTRKLSSARSLSSMEESYFLQASLDSSEIVSERRNFGETNVSPYYMKSITPSAFEATLRQKEGELISYMSRLSSLESIRDSLAEELVKMTAQCEKLRSEASMIPSIRAELEALRRRHSAALELMGERDEELEELRADIIDMKEMYREQVNLLVNKIQILASSSDAA